MADEKKAPAPKAKEKKTFKAYKEAAKRCPKCSSRLADHKNRFSCGKCGYSEFKAKA
jgi:small subunit ribosomal protein S27Ae